MITPTILNLKNNLLYNFISEFKHFLFLLSAARRIFESVANLEGTLFETWRFSRIYNQIKFKKFRFQLF